VKIAPVGEPESAAIPWSIPCRTQGFPGISPHNRRVTFMGRQNWRVNRKHPKSSRSRPDSVVFHQFEPLFAKLNDRRPLENPGFMGLWPWI
jgi:hypothetical protein